MALIRINNRSSEDTAIYGRRNLIINGGMTVAQRGTSNTGFTYGYALDRMYLDQFNATGTTHTYAQYNTSNGTPPTGFLNYMRFQRNSGATDTGAMRIYYTGETNASGGIAGKKLTLTFYARVGSDYSGGAVQSRIVTGEGTNQNRNSWANGTWTNQVNDDQNNTLTTSWQRFTHTTSAVAGNSVSQHAVRFYWSPTGTASTNDYVEITGIQLEIGDKATPFEHLSYQEELRLCQRYYINMSLTANDGGVSSYGRDGQYTHVRHCIVYFPVEMRANPTIQIQSSTANSMDRYGRGQETCYPVAENIKTWGFQNVIKKDSGGTNQAWSDAPNYINRAGFDAEAEL